MYLGLVAVFSKILHYRESLQLDCELQRLKVESCFHFTQACYRDGESTCPPLLITTDHHLFLKQWLCWLKRVSGIWIYRIKSNYNKLEEPTDEEENDMLDLAFGLTKAWTFSLTLNPKKKKKRSVSNVPSNKKIVSEHDWDAKSLQDQSLMVCVWPFHQPQGTLQLMDLFQNLISFLQTDR